MGNATANVRLRFYPNGGGDYKHQVTADIPPGTTHFFPTASYGQLGSCYGPAVVESTNGVPITAVVREWKTGSGGPDLAYHGLSSTANHLYLPSQHKDSWGWASWVHVQNPTNNDVWVRMKYYPTSGGGTLHETAEQYIPLMGPRTSGLGILH